MGYSLAQLQAHAVETHAIQLGPGMEYYGQQWGDVLGPQFENITGQLKNLIESRPGGRWLEIGCGGGRWTRHLLDLDPNMSLMLLDGTEAAFHLTRKYIGADFNKRIADTAVSTDGLIDFRERYFDHAFSFDVFVHFPPLLFWTYLDTLSKAIKRGGTFSFNYARQFHRERAWRNGTGCFEYYSHGSVLSWLDSLGFAVTYEHSFPQGYGSHFLTVVKM